MNLIILICIVGSQLIFQALYFEKYYIGKKENKLEKSLSSFEEFLSIPRTNEAIINFINDTKKSDNIALAYRDLSLRNGFSLETYMGQRQIVIKDYENDKEYKVILGDQFPKIKIKKGDTVQVYGVINEFGYLFTESIMINGNAISPYYNIIPSETLDTQKSILALPSYEVPIGEDNYIEGSIEYVIPEDNSYYILSNADLFLDYEVRSNIFSKSKYTTKANALNNIGEILLVSEKISNGYLIAITPLTEVNDVFGTMNSYYLIIFTVAFLVVISVSLVYSRFMTKPLVEMSNIARKISECDFQYKYNVKSEDEMGVLGNSLNSISSNLEKSLSELQEANEKLKKEMGIKNIQEEKRKELIANISHELKTPITIIQGSINGVKSGMYTEDMYEDILEETNKMNELVKEMLEISKLESHSFILNKEPFDLGSIFLKEKDKLKSMIQEKNLIINCNDFHEIIAFGDEKRINQVVTNLLTNAIKYTPDGGKINVLIKLNEEDQCVFEIENFGVTLTKEEIEKIWDPFYRKEQSRNKRFGGTGLGLSIVKRILEVHHSNFGVESTENSVKFYFTIQKCMAY